LLDSTELLNFRKIAESRNIKGAHFAVGCGYSYHRQTLPKELDVKRSSGTLAPEIQPLMPLQEMLQADRRAELLSCRHRNPTLSAGGAQTHSLSTYSVGAEVRSGCKAALRPQPG
jgi:hypothetical protein